MDTLQCNTQNTTIAGEQTFVLEKQALSAALSTPAAPIITPLVDHEETGGSEKSSHLQQLVISGLQSSPPSLPSLLLWDDHGSQRFDALTQHPRYYPSHTEMEMIYQNAQEIASFVPAGSTIIELGCGNLKKTSIILSAVESLQRPVTYYALDVSVGELEINLINLSERLSESKFVNIRGLHGTYDNCAEWLAAPSSSFKQTSASSVITFLWLGNSMANMQPEVATGLLQRLRSACLVSGSTPQFLISADACANSDIVLDAYRPDYQAFIDFTTSGLRAANHVLAQEVFHDIDFRCETSFGVNEGLLQVFLVANRRLELQLNENILSNTPIILQKDQKIPIIHSYKWSRDAFDRICQQAGLKVKQSWENDKIQYRERPFYVLLGKFH